MSDIEYIVLDEYTEQWEIDKSWNSEEVVNYWPTDQFKYNTGAHFPHEVEGRKSEKVIRLVVNYVLKFVREYYRFEHEMIMMLRGLEDKIKVGMNYE